MTALFFLLVLMWNVRKDALANQGCGSVVWGVLTSPGYPEKYLGNMTCTYSVPIPSGMVMGIYFDKFNLDGHRDYPCTEDYLKITNEKNEIFGVCCGEQSGNLIRATGTYVVLTFISSTGSAFQEKGFQIRFLPLSPGCGSVVSGILLSPGYPNNYPSNITCTYMVPIPPGMKMGIYFDYFNLEGHRDYPCRGDYLKITNENNEIFGVCCGEQSGNLIHATGTNAVLIFISGSAFQRKGFVIHFLPLSPDCGSVVNNTLNSPGYPNHLLGNMVCFYSVPITQGTTMEIYFKEFSLDGTSFTETLMIGNEKWKTTEINLYTGDESGKTIIVQGNYVMLQFSSGPWRTRFRNLGFRILFTAVPFAGPKVILLDPSPVVYLIRGYKLPWSVTGTPPIYTALIRNSTVLVNTTKQEPFKVDEEGNYTCLAINKYGMEMKEFSVTFNGGFYSNEMAFVGKGCKKCPNGSFVPYDKAPGKQASDCKSCPPGTEADLFAGYRSCQCLEGFYRTDMFKECKKCGDGLQCKDDYASLKSGYWWKWRNENHKRRYKEFIKNLLKPIPALGKNDVQYPYPIPIQYKCRMESSCKGGLDSECENGYEGPLCDVCSLNHYKQFQACKRCPSRNWMVGQLSIIAVILVLILVVSVYVTRKSKKNDKERSPIDVLLAKLKIAVGFYQVTYALLEAFSYIQWPNSIQVIGTYSEILQLNILQMAPVHCLFPGLRVDAFRNLFAIMSVNCVIIIASGTVYVVRKLVILSDKNVEVNEKLKRVKQTKEVVFRNLFFFMYVTYLSTCSKTAAVLPLTCQKLCRDDKEEGSCLQYLKADYSTRCDDSRYKQSVVVAYISIVYVIALPVATFIALWRQRNQIAATKGSKTSRKEESTTELITGLSFLYESYKPSSWYWELIEMSRKVIITFGLILVGQETRSYIGLTLVIAGMYGTLFCWIHPLQDIFENRLMSTSISVTVVNLVVGAVSRIPAENIPDYNDSYMDSLVFNILVLGANTAVTALLVVQYAVHLYEYLKEWRRHPKLSCSCCLALTLLIIDIPGDMSGLANTNMLNTQLDPGHMEMITVVGAVQESGAIHIVLEQREQHEQGNGDSKGVEEGNCNNTQLKTVDTEMVTNVRAVKNCGAVDVPFEDGEQFKVKCVKVREGIDGVTRFTIIKCHQGTQTELSAHLLIPHVGEQEPRKETGF